MIHNCYSHVLYKKLHAYHAISLDNSVLYVLQELQVTMQFNPKLEGGYDCTFLEPPKELQYECVICKNVLRHPCHLDCDCDIRFCYACIKPISNQKKPCPHCKRAFTTLTPDKKLERELGQKEVIYNGKMLKLKELYGIRCKHCHISFKSTSELHDHEIECGLRPYTCDYCGQYQSTCDGVTLKHWPVCPSRPVPCPNKCGASPERQDLASHVDNDCPLTVVDCVLHYAGCAVRLPRKDMPDHLREAVVTHTSLQTDFFRTTIERKNKEVEQEQTDRFREMQQEIRKEMEPMKHDESKVQKTVHMRSFGVALLNSFRFALPMLIILICAISFSLWSNYHNDLQKRNEKLYFSDFDVQFDLDFYKHNQSSAPWFSPPFYRNGYKLCLEVSTDKGTGTHLSVLVHLMRGEFDDQLQWPFEGDITIQLLNQRGEDDHLDHTIHFTDKIPDSYARRVVNQDKADLGYGRMKFVSHRELKSRYIKNDRLRFQVKPSTFSRAKAIKLQFSDLEVQFDLMNFHIRNQSSAPWFSPPFYRDGYKLCLEVSTDKGTGTHLSVLVHLMQGEFDDQLKWPFEGDITIQLLNQRGEDNHLDHTIHFTDKIPDSYAGRVVNQDRADLGYGRMKFISHRELKSRYIKNDRLRFQVKPSTFSRAKAIKLHFSDLEEQFDMVGFHNYNESGTPWYSPPFYRNGYKLCLEVSTDKGIGTHLSVLVHLMRGEFDDQLVWPFEGDITIQLLNQRGEDDHLDHTIHFTDKIPDSYAGRVANQDRADLGYGRMKFVSHRELKSRYIKSDRLRFQVKPSTFSTAKALKLHFSDLEEQFDMVGFHNYNESGTPWLSPPFYRNGYKLCLVCKTSSGSHLSVHVHLMRGDFDDQLKWPFQGNITIRLLDQTGGEKDHEETIHFTDVVANSYAAKVLKKDIISDTGYGIPKFLSHSELRLPYLKNDALRFQIQPSSYNIGKDRVIKGIEKDLDDLQMRHSVQRQTLKYLEDSVQLQGELAESLTKLLGGQFVMHHFSRYTATSGSWFSSPFYVDGYKLCLEVCTKSHTHIFVGIHLMQGEFDDKLSWPFRGDITVQLLSQKKLLIQHYERIIHFNDLTPEGLADRVINSGEAHGYPHFIDRDQLEPNYLLNDELHFRLLYSN